MSEEGKELQGSLEVPEDSLSDANGGMYGELCGQPLHRNCGGRIWGTDLLGVTVFWQCGKCSERHLSLSDFDHYYSKCGPMY